MIQNTEIECTMMYFRVDRELINSKYVWELTAYKSKINVLCYESHAYTRVVQVPVQKQDNIKTKLSCIHKSGAGANSKIR
jgi:hypothetical protein